jgi:integrase
MKSNEGNGNGGKGVFRIVEFINPSRNVAYRVTGWTMDGKRVRENFKTHDEALAKKTRLSVEAANISTAGQTVFTRLTPAQVNEAETVFARLKVLGYTSLLFVLDFFERNYRDPLKRISALDAVTKFVAEKESAKRRARYIKDLRQELGYLTKKHGSKSVHEIQKDDLVGVIDVTGRGAERQNNIRKDYRTFFNWCVANGYAQSNPAELVPQKTIERGEIVTLPISKVKDLMKHAANYKEGKLVPYVALGTFCAIRPDELARLSWEQIDLREKHVTITASAAKKRGRRIVDIPDNCLAWLRPHASKKTPIKGANWRKDFDALKEKIGFGSPTDEEKEKSLPPKLAPWPQDVLRHTGISCHYRLNGDEAKTASWAGNSPDMIHAHYRALMSAKDAKAFFEIRPAGQSRRKRGKVIALNTEAAMPADAVAAAR